MPSSTAAAKRASRRSPAWTPQSAFTLLELVVILILLAILATGAMSFLSGSRDDGPWRDRADLIAAWRYAQTLAMADSSRGVGVQISSNSFRIYDSSGNLLRPDGNGSYPQLASEGVSFSPAITACFNGLGEVLLNCAGNPVGFTLAFQRDGVTQTSACVERSGYIRAC